MRARGSLIALAIALAAPAAAEPALIASLAPASVAITTGFSGTTLLVFGTTATPLGPEDGVLVVVRGPPRAIVVRQKVQMAGLIWVNGPAARFDPVPGFFAVADSGPGAALPDAVRRAEALGLEQLTAAATRPAAAFAVALARLEQDAERWSEAAAGVEVAGGRLFQLRLALPATVPTGAYAVDVLLVRGQAIAARATLGFEVNRVGAANQIARLARDRPLVYGLGCIVLAAAAGWAGSIVFRRG